MESCVRHLPMTQMAGGQPVTRLVVTGLDGAELERRLRRARVPEYLWDDIEMWLTVMLAEFVRCQEIEALAFSAADLNFFDWPENEDDAAR
jgi:hypothetical protein